MRKAPRSPWLAVSLLAASLMGIASRSDAEHYPWERPPGPIAGRWRMSCETRGPMVVEVTLQGDRKAVGRVASLGGKASFGYKLDEEVLRVEANDFGAWVGHQLWRGASGASRWDPIYLLATDDTLNGTMTTDDCWKGMTRVK